MSKKSINDIRVPTYDDLFTNEEQRQEAKLEKIMEVPVEDIQEFKNHPFRVRNDEQMSFRSQKNECSSGKWSRKDTGYCKRTY